MLSLKKNHIYLALYVIFIFSLFILVDQYLNKTLNYEKNRTTGMLCPDNYTIYGYCKGKNLQVKNLDTNEFIDLYIDENKIEEKITKIDDKIELNNGLVGDK